MIYVTFFMEQHLGHQVHYQNLRHFIDKNQDISATWVPITYTEKNGLWEKFSFLPKKLRGSLTGRHQVNLGLQVEPCDVLYFNTQVPAALKNPKKNGKPYVISTDITPIQYDQLADFYGHNPDAKGPLRWYKHQVNSQIFKGAACVLPWSSWASKSLITHYGVDPDRIKVMPVGVDLQVWHPSVRTYQKPVQILFVGGDFARKGGNLLLKAFRSLPAGSAQLVLVTRTNIPPEKYITVLRNIHPNSDELISLYQMSDIFVLPSLGEAFGIAAVEASAVGLPIIATSIAGLTDIVIHEETGFIIPVGDAQALTAGLRVLMENEDLRQKMGFAAYQRAKENFDAKKNAERLVNILIEAVSERERL